MARTIREQILENARTYGRPAAELVGSHQARLAPMARPGWTRVASAWNGPGRGAPTRRGHRPTPVSLPASVHARDPETPSATTPSSSWGQVVEEQRRIVEQLTRLEATIERWSALAEHPPVAPPDPMLERRLSELVAEVRAALVARPSAAVPAAPRGNVPAARPERSARVAIDDVQGLIDSLVGG
ncbi:MAG: hypothetical protein KDC38_13980 [Planctomycetes bacterium]|nr:hypothetical protein [Planctomycetota bacterium]